MASQTMSSNTSENRILLQMCNGCGDQMEILKSQKKKKIQIVNFEFVEDVTTFSGQKIVNLAKGR